MDARTNTQTHSAAYYFLEGLNEVGIDYLFCNFGTDHAPIIEALANRRSRGEPCPRSSAARTRTPPPTWPAAMRW